jgi:hypothetical protein
MLEGLDLDGYTVLADMEVIVFSRPLEPMRFAPWCYQRGWRLRTERRYANNGPGDKRSDPYRWQPRG